MTVHLCHDGNGRTARLLATSILQRDGYGLEGRAGADLTGWLEYFTDLVAAALGISDRMARILVTGWITAGFLVAIGAAKKTRRYGLMEEYRRYVESD